MKNAMTSLIVGGLFAITGCGASEEEKNKTIEEAAEMRAKQVCQNDGSLEQYGQKLDYLTEQLQEEGISDDASIEKATQLFDEKIKASCPDKMPK